MTSRWDFVFAAYAVTALGTIIVVAQSWLAMRRAERRAETMLDAANQSTKAQ